MDIAKCVLDNETYTAWDFSRLPPSELSTKRKHLVCIECQAVAFLGKRLVTGRPHVSELSRISQVAHLPYLTPKM